MKRKRKIPAIHVQDALMLAALHGQRWRGRIYIPQWILDGHRRR